MSMTVRDAAGASVRLDPRPFALGGEAAVHAVPDFPGAVVKLYHPEVLAKRGTGLRAKIEAMAGDPRLAVLKQHPRLAWPCFPVFDARGGWRGYAMRRAHGVRLTVLAHAKAYREHFPALDRPAVVAYLLDLLDTVQCLHAQGVMLGDYNLANFLADPRQPAVTLIDCDSWQLRAAGRHFHCAVAAADMLAPELHGRTLGEVQRTPGSEHFSIAILLFKALMLGRHPYDVVGGSGPVENIRNGYFPYGLGARGIPKGPWYNIWSHLPHRLKEQFIRTFREGAGDPSARSTLADWIDVLKLYRRELAKGWHEGAMRPDEPKRRDYRGQQALADAG